MQYDNEICIYLLGTTVFKHLFLSLSLFQTNNNNKNKTKNFLFSFCCLFCLD